MKKKVTTKKSPAVDRRLVKELQSMLAEQKGVEVLGHIAVPAYCCGNGTVAVVKIQQRARPAAKKAK